MIYFLKRADQLVKVGYTDNFKKRLYVLESEHGKLDLLGWMDGDRKLEKQLHARFDSDRATLEWFRQSDALLAFIAENTTTESPEIIPTATIRISSTTRAVLDYIMAMGTIKTGRTPTINEVLWEVLTKAYPEEVEKVLSFGATPPKPDGRRQS